MSNLLYPDEVKEVIDDLIYARRRLVEYKGPLHNHPKLQTKVEYMMNELIDTLQEVLEEE